MKILVFSDSHGSANGMLRITEAESPQMVLFCGDGARDFGKLCAAFPQIDCEGVGGNCDYGSNLPELQLLEIQGKRIFLTHGHLYHAKYSYDTAIYAAEEQRADLICFGHTHTPYRDMVRGLNIINPGSVADGRYAIVEITDSGKIITKLAKFNA
jgi:putative phosphoesterase